MTEKAAASALTLKVECKGSVTLVHCHGKLVAGVNDTFYAKVSQLIPGTTRIVLDLTDLAYMDSAGLGALVRLYVSAKSAGSDLELVNLGKRIQDLLKLTHLWSVFTILGENGITMRF